MPGNIIELTPELIASWPTPNYDDPWEKRWMVPFAVSFYGVASLTLFVRIWLRATKQAGLFGWDDGLLLFGFIASTAFTVDSIIVSEKYHLGRHTWDIPSTILPDTVLLVWIAELAFLLTGGATKISVLLFYRRLTVKVGRGWKWSIIAAIVFTAGWTIAITCALIFNCTPVDAYWKSFSPIYDTTHDYHCVDTKVLNLLTGILSVLSDFYSVTIPLVLSRELQIATRQRVALNIIFSLGLVATAAGAVRTYWLWQTGQPNRDPTESIWNVYIWATIELQMSIACASAPALRVFFRRYLSSPVTRLTNTIKSGSSRLGEGGTSRSRTGKRESQEHIIGADGIELESSKVLVTRTVAMEEDRQEATPAGLQAGVEGGWDGGAVRSPKEYEEFNRSNLDKARGAWL